MHFSSILAVGGLLTSTLAKPISEFDLIRRQIPSRPCSSGVHVIAASGDGVNNIGKYGRLGSLATSVLNAIPDSSNVTLPYDKGTSDTNEKVTSGVNNMYLYLRQYHSHCPNTRIALMGYSAGGMIVMNTLCGASGGSIFTPTGPLPSNWTSVVIGATAYGEETHAANQTWNRGGCYKNNAPNWPRQNNNQCAAWASRLMSWCDGDDGECCAGGLRPAAHFEYPQKDDGAATQFFVQQYKATGGKNLG